MRREHVESVRSAPPILTESSGRFVLPVPKKRLRKSPKDPVLGSSKRKELSVRKVSEGHSKQSYPPVIPPRSNL